MLTNLNFARRTAPWELAYVLAAIEPRNARWLTAPTGWTRCGWLKTLSSRHAPDKWIDL